MTYKPAANRPMPEVRSVQGTAKEMMNTSLSYCLKFQINTLYHVKVRKNPRKHAAVYIYVIQHIPWASPMAQVLAWLCPFSPLSPFNHNHEQPPHTWPSQSKDRATTQAGDCRSFSFLSLNPVPTFTTLSCLIPPSLFLCSASLMQAHVLHFRAHGKALWARDDGEPRQGLAASLSCLQTFWDKWTHPVYQGQHSSSAALTAPHTGKGNTDVTGELWPGLLL